MRGKHGIALMDELLSFLATVVAMSMLFASIVAGHVAHEARRLGDRLQAAADDLVDRVAADERWTDGEGMFDANALNLTSDGTVEELAGGRPCQVTVRDLATDIRWVYGEARPGDRRTSARVANVYMGKIDPARVVVTVWAE